MACGKAVAVLILALLGLQGVIGEGIECEKLPVEMCAFAVSSSGARCVLEKNYYATPDQKLVQVYECQSSGVTAEKMMEWIESEECVQACGLERMSAGMSSDGLSENSHFTSKLCSDSCQNSCPNIVDLYLNLAAGEGMYLPKLCEAHHTRSRRVTLETAPAPGYSIGALKASAPAFSPV